jgi:hypothetical protein
MLGREGSPFVRRSFYAARTERLALARTAVKQHHFRGTLLAASSPLKFRRKHPPYSHPPGGSTYGEPGPPTPTFRQPLATPKPPLSARAMRKKPILWARFTVLMEHVNRLTAFRSACLAPQVGLDPTTPRLTDELSFRPMTATAREWRCSAITQFSLNRDRRVPDVPLPTKPAMVRHQLFSALSAHAVRRLLGLFTGVHFLSFTRSPANSALARHV